MIFGVFYIACALVAWVLGSIFTAIAFSRDFGNDEPDAETWMASVAIGLVTCMLWPLTLLAVGMYFFVTRLYARLRSIEREYEEARR